ncbi:MAG: DMT family transporter [Rhodospirillaceae bacterium]|nr:DMT family transporter [Rhodospirillaceae bacterium]MBT3627470.1 DMT family transporter [Rhodospirillaceae bacterium]MBT3926796.1 DMT family transporter [Rhodospirillaceae bacterium]MBT5039698.1 DMT family transporter [Rhodospirillaceae bacterium]MBT5674886.1 DMT family transporter [Rhodospirillaceae bacterium]
MTERPAQIFAFFGAIYLRLPGQMRGMLLLLCATILFSSMHALIRHVGEAQHPFEMAFFRNLFGIIVLAPFFMRYGFGILRTKRLGLHAIRGGVHVGSMLLFFTAVTVAPLATVAAMSFTAPLFVTLGAVLLLGEKIRARRIGALLIGFAGVMIVLRPGAGDLELGALMALGSSVIWACALLMIKVLARTESSLTLTAYMALFLTPLSAIPAAFVWQWPSWEELGWLALMGSVGTAGHLCLAQAFREADATTVLPLDFLRLIWASLLGFFLFGQVPELFVWIGGAVIFSSTIYLTYREAVVSRQSKKINDPPLPPG